MKSTACFLASLCLMILMSASALASDASATTPPGSAKVDGDARAERSESLAATPQRDRDFDFPRISKPQAGKPKKMIKTNSCNACICHATCDVWANYCKAAPAEHCRQSNGIPNCECFGPCVCGA